MGGGRGTCQDQGCDPACFQIHKLINLMLPTSWGRTVGFRTSVTSTSRPEHKGPTAPVRYKDREGREIAIRLTHVVQDSVWEERVGYTGSRLCLSSRFRRMFTLRGLEGSCPDAPQNPNVQPPPSGEEGNRDSRTVFVVANTGFLRGWINPWFICCRAMRSGSGEREEWCVPWLRNRYRPQIDGPENLPSGLGDLLQHN